MKIWQEDSVSIPSIKFSTNPTETGFTDITSIANFFLLGLKYGLSKNEVLQYSIELVVDWATESAPNKALILSFIELNEFTASITTAIRADVTPPYKGFKIYNSTTSKVEWWNGSGWDTTGGSAGGGLIQIDSFNYITSGSGSTVPYVVNNIRELDHEGNGTRTYYYQAISSSAKSGAKLKIWTETDDFAGNTFTATLYVNGVLDTTIDAVDIMPDANGVWQLQELTLNTNIAIGDVIDIKLISQAGNNNFNAWRNFWID